jgi:3-phosphoglycerate kinase
MNLPTINGVNVTGKRVLVRADLDVNLEDTFEQYRLKSLLPTLKYLTDNKAKVIIIGHIGRPEGKVDPKYSLEKVSNVLSELSGIKIAFSSELLGTESKTKIEKLGEGEAIMLENLRFDPREESNDEGFAKELASLAEIYVNEAFSVSHRVHASIVGIPKYLPHFAGLRFVEEIDNLSKIIEGAEKPVVVIIGGAKEDKLKYVDGIKSFADKILIGGRLPDYLGDLGSIRSVPSSEQVVTGNLIMDKEDISIHTIERFTEEIKKAKTILLAGPMGKYEEEGHRQGTEEVFKAVVESDAKKVAGGGDTIRAISILGLAEKFDYISVGGGAMLEFLTKKTLPGVEALIN